jgi:hypothetical protein
VDGDRLTAARIAAVTRRHARRTPLTAEQEAAALDDLAGLGAYGKEKVYGSIP